jgi:cell division protein FtsI/penicillin-binding protein 2
MASVPGFDPNQVKNAASFKQLNADKSAPLVNRPTRAPMSRGRR